MPKFKATLAAKRERALAVGKVLRKAYPTAGCSLEHRDPLELLISTILSAQCTDVRVNRVTKVLFGEFKSAQDYVEKPRRRLETIIHSCGVYRNKAKNIANACRKIIDEFGGEVPQTLEKLLQLDGVGRKTANLVLGDCFGVPGVVVDTHCKRLAARLGFTREENPAKIEQDLVKIWPREDWSLFSHLMVFHGRAVCHARGPKCPECQVRAHCPFPESRGGKAAVK